MNETRKKIIRSVFRIWNSESQQGEEWKRSYPEWKKLHGHHERLIRNWKTWLKSRRREEGAEGLWRIHDKLYDLEEWASKHPGGQSWIAITKGTDITEAFEAHHIGGAAEAILPKFFVREAVSPRNSPFTFRKDGFYMTLKERVRLKLASVPKGPSFPSKVVADGLATAMFVSCILAALFTSFSLSIIGGLFLALTVISSHNFFHLRDNWRMYYFNFSLMSYRDWRVSHAMSHHIFPNTTYDLEVDMFDPFFQWLPKENKTFIARYGSWLYSPIIYTFIFLIQFSQRIFTHPDGVNEFIPLLLPAAMALTLVDPLMVLILWVVTILSGSFFFSFIGINAAHHHPDLFHDGDIPREDRDWGLFQLDAVKDRVEIKGILPLVLTLFGDHALHHLFPTIDHYHLVGLYPVFEETCKEFGFDFRFTTFFDLVKGQFLQLARIEPKNHAQPTKEITRL